MDRCEPGGVTLRTVDPVDRVALGLEDGLLRFTARARDDRVVPGAGFVDQAVALLLRLVDLVPRRLDRVGRVHVLQDDLLDRDAHLVLGHECLQPLFDLRLDILPADGQHLGDRPVADDLAHDGFVHRAEGGFDVTDFKQELVGIRHAILHDPFNDGDVQIAGQHDGLIGELAFREAAADAGFDGAEAKLHLELALHRHLDYRLGERQLGAQPRLRGADVAPEPQHDADFLRLHLVERAEQPNQDEHGDHAHLDRFGRDIRQP